MRANPQEWEVVLLGSWNVAILTPRGIARRLFELEEGTSVQVFVPLEGVAPIQVAHDDITVLPSNSRLTLMPNVCNGEKLRAACTIAGRALRKLPETPVGAAGVNFRFRLPETPPELFSIFDSPFNDLCADAKLPVHSRKVRWTTSWQDGELNLDFEQANDASTALLFNFHRTSSVSTELADWVSRCEQMLALVQSLLSDTLKVEIEYGT